MRASLAAIFMLCALAGTARASLLEAVEAFRKGDFAAGVAACRAPAEAGDASCQNFLGMVYSTGKGAKADPAEAVRWFRKAAEQGHGYAANNLGYAYASGRGVGKDLAQAEKWFRVAAEQGIPDAELSVGLLLIGRQESKEAVKWFRRAAAQGLPAAQSELGGAYENGEGVKANLGLAVKWYLVAAEHGDSHAQARLGFLYEAGRGLETDLAEAYFWHTVALRDAKNPYRKDEEAALKRIAARLGKDEVAAAEIAARAWQPEPADVADAPKPKGRRGAKEREPSGMAAHATGTGFVVSRAGHVITNNHVVDQCREVRVTEGDKATPVSVLAADRDRDLALVKLPHGAPAAALFRGEPAARPGESVVVLGFPLAGLLASEPIVTTGIVSALAGPRDDRRLLQFSAPIQPGNSGGPLLDAGGRVVGVVVATLSTIKLALTTGAIPENINFAVKAEEARQFLLAQGVMPETGGGAGDLSTAAVAEQGLQITLRLECWR